MPLSASNSRQCKIGCTSPFSFAQRQGAYWRQVSLFATGETFPDRSAAGGKRTVTRSPERPGPQMFSSAIEPPRLSTTRFTMDKPRALPSPSGREPRKNGSKIRSNSQGAIPGPVSSTCSTAASSWDSRHNGPGLPRRRTRICGWTGFAGTSLFLDEHLAGDVVLGCFHLDAAAWRNRRRFP
jgi:hypothetical protein